MTFTMEALGHGEGEELATKAAEEHEGLGVVSFVHLRVLCG
jgi:hypothetical protein